MPCILYYIVIYSRGLFFAVTEIREIKILMKIKSLVGYAFASQVFVGPNGSTPVYRANPRHSYIKINSPPLPLEKQTKEKRNSFLFLVGAVSDTRLQHGALACSKYTGNHTVPLASSKTVALFSPSLILPGNTCTLYSRTGKGEKGWIACTVPKTLILSRNAFSMMALRTLRPWSSWFRTTLSRRQISGGT